MCELRLPRRIGYEVRLPTEADDPRKWLRAALTKGLARPVRHEGCLRYAWPLGQNARARRRVEIAMAAREYPTWDAGQLPLFM